MSSLNQNHYLARLRNSLQAISWEPWLLLASEILMVNISWLKSSDLLIDYGEQAYIAWRLSTVSVTIREPGNYWVSNGFLKICRPLLQPILRLFTTIFLSSNTAFLGRILGKMSTNGYRRITSHSK